MSFTVIRRIPIASRLQLTALSKYAGRERGHRWLSTNHNTAINDTKKSILTDHGSHLITLVDPHGEKHAFKAADGDTVLDIAKSKKLEIEGACEGECACSTCHVVVASEQDYDKLVPATEKEEDMLDLAFGVTNTSRLACQVKMAPGLDGISIMLPGVVRDVRAANEISA